MKNKKAPSKAAARGQQAIGLYAAGGAALILFLWAYSPVVHAPFLFDDNKQIFALTEGSSSLWTWIHTPVRPLLMATYWANNQISGLDTYSYHAGNLLIHLLAAALVFLIVRRLAEWAKIGAQKRDLLSAFAAALFLLHPAQTESVAYIAGRSESFSGLLACAAFAVFLYRRDSAVSWLNVAVIVALSMAAMLSKEQAVVLFGLFLLTDFWWNPGFSFQGVKANWRLYVPMLAGALCAVALFAKLILGIGTGNSAGFGLKEFTWYQYLFTQFRGIWVYIGSFLFPANLNVDWDFPISRSILDHGAIFGLIALLGAAVAAWTLRKRFPLASFGFFMFLLLLAPTSSILPIKDPVADRRIYLPMIGLLLVAVDFASRLKVDRKMLAGVCTVAIGIAAIATHSRAEVWSDPVALWEDTARKSPEKYRAHFQLAFAYYEQQQYDRAIPEFEKTAALIQPDYDLLLDWGLAYDGLHQSDKALEKLRQAAAKEPKAHVYTQIAKVYADRRDWQNAMTALDMAEKLDPGFAHTYAYKGLLHLAQGDPAGAVPLFQHALVLDPAHKQAREGLLQAQQMMRARR
jgi:protein O-mannosyl-transferase